MPSGADDRSIVHVDLDAFFAAVEQLDNPELRGQPVLVGGQGPRAVVATASYEARPFGCRSAMPMALARRLCPQAIVVPPRFWRYRELSDAMFDILDDFTPVIEPLSIDEAFLDLSGTQRLLGGAQTVARRIKQRVRDELKLTISVGVAPNKFLAKLASDLHKPDGLTIVGREDVDRLLPPLPISRIWGIGPRTQARLNDLGIRTIGDIRKLPLELLVQNFGSEGERYYRLARGLDDRPVTPDSRAKSIGQEQTFGIDIADAEELRRILLGQVEQVAWRLRRSGLRAGGVTLKIRDGQFNTITRAGRLAEPTDLTKPLWDAARTVFDAWAHTQFKPLRLLGVQATRLSGEAPQLPLFDDEQQQRQRRVDDAIDRIRQKYGQAAVRRGQVTRRQTNQQNES
ncbi:DNA polymerase IV [Fontivita pretiosa]|uniref:DNA polymerase IV n=1 Tax=Fontivita pretiosa TaxID=2989684 RepID=UPI003D177208